MTGARTRGIVFDKDGTLFDFARTWEAWAQAILRRLGRDEAEARHLGGLIGFDLDAGRFHRNSVVIAGTPWEVAAILNRHLPDLKKSQIIAILNEEAMRTPQKETTALKPLLTGLRQTGFRLGVATNDAEAPARSHLQTAGVLEFFDLVFGYDSGHGGKPAPGQLLAFASQTGLDPSACVMVGDSRHDLTAGRSAGFGTVGVLTGAADIDDLRDLADVVLPDIGHLADWVTRER